MEICYIMNKEETLSNLKAYLDGDTAIGNIIPFRSALESAIRYLETPLPSNLDEAAQRIAYDVCKQLPNGEEKDGIVYYAILAAIAGAEWIAGQFQKIEDIAEDHSTNFEKMAKEAEALDALADWWIENYCNKDAGFDESSFHIGFCLGWQQHEKGMTAVENLKAKKKVQDNPAPEKLIKNKSCGLQTNAKIRKLIGENKQNDE